MSTYIKNYGITKTFIKDNGHNIDNELKWMGDYDGDTANIQIDIDNNGSKEFVSMRLDNDDLMQLLGVQPVQMSLEQRLSQDFLGKPYSSITLEGALIKRKTHKHRRHHKKHHKRHHKKHISLKKRRTYKM